MKKYLSVAAVLFLGALFLSAAHSVSANPECIPGDPTLIVGCTTLTPVDNLPVVDYTNYCLLNKNLCSGNTPINTGGTPTEGGGTGTGDTPITTIPIADHIDISPSSMEILVNDHILVTAVVKDKDNKPVFVLNRFVWSSADPYTASVIASDTSSTGVNGWKPGTTKITVSHGGLSASATVTVVSTKIKTIEIQPFINMKFAVGATQTFTAHAFDAGHNEVIPAVPFTWKTSTTPRFKLVSSTSNSITVIGDSSGTTFIQATVFEVPSSQIPVEIIPAVPPPSNNVVTSTLPPPITSDPTSPPTSTPPPVVSPTPTPSPTPTVRPVVSFTPDKYSVKTGGIVNLMMSIRYTKSCSMTSTVGGVTTTIPNIGPDASDTWDIMTTHIYPPFPLTFTKTTSYMFVTCKNAIGETKSLPFTINVIPLPTLLGDVNTDGVVNILDAQKLAVFTTGASFLTPVQQANADVSKDGKLDAIDVDLINKYVAGLIVNF